MAPCDPRPGRVWEYDGRHELSEDEILEVGRRWGPQPFHVDPVAAEASISGGLVYEHENSFLIHCRDA